MSRDIAFVVSVSGPGVSPARQMDYSAAYALRGLGQQPDVVARALGVRAVVNDYYRGRATRSDAEQAMIVSPKRNGPAGLWLLTAVREGANIIPAVELEAAAASLTDPAEAAAIFEERSDIESPQVIVRRASNTPIEYFVKWNDLIS